MKKILFITWTILTLLLVATVTVFAVAEGQGLTLIELFK